ncbi:MAG: ABC transporter ATP-binding protein, partial [Alphaproteobacteria bacterium]
SASASPWAAPSCASRRRSCSTSRSPTSTPSCACRCAPRSASCTIA